MQHDHAGAFVADTPERTAAASGSLDGIDTAVKDCFAVAGHTSSFGIARWRETHHPAAADSAVVSRLLRSGSDVVGMTQLDQLAFSVVGDVNEDDPPLNPRHPEFRCGGSSSGSAAAVASGMASLGVGTDTAGSTRIPAALCGIHGLRPTWGAIDMTGCLPLAPSLDTVGLLAANPAVMRKALAVLGSHAVSGSAVPGGVAFDTVLVDPELAGAQGEVILGAAQEVARVLGCRVSTVRVGYLFGNDVADLLARVQGREVWANLGRWVTENEDALDPDVAWRLNMCRRYSAENTATIAVDTEDRRRLTEILGGIVEPGALLVAPVLSGPGPRVDDAAEDLAGFRRRCLALAAPAGLAGWPQLVWSRFGVAPMEHSAIGLLARPGSDSALVELLAALWDDEQGRDQPGDASRPGPASGAAGQIRSTGGTNT